MKKLLIPAAILLFAAISCNESPRSAFNRKVADYAVVTIEAPDLSGITDNGKEVLNLYRFAADQIDSIYWKQYFGDRETLLGSIEDPVQKTFAEINYGPWDRFNGRSFVEGWSDRPLGAGFYPADMSVSEFEEWNCAEKSSPYTLVRRDENGALKTVWYHDEYKENLEKIASYLKAAADITIKPSVKNYLLKKADALLSDNYYDSSIAWLEMNDSKMDLVIGPDEVTDDQLLGIKRSYEAFVFLKNQARTDELTQYVSSLPSFQEELPGDPAYKAFQPGAGSNIFSCDALYYAGKANAGVKVIAINRPIDADVQADMGTRTILIENIIKAKYNYIVSPMGELLLDPAFSAHLSYDAFFWNIVFREVAHGLGVKQTLDGKGSVIEALGKTAPTMETIKANTAGVLLVCSLQNHYDIHHIFTKEDALTTFFASILRSVRFGEGSTLGRSNFIIYNYLGEKGAYQRKASGQYTLDLAKMEEALSELTATVLKIQATGDLDAALELENNYSKKGANNDADVLAAGLEKIPADIRFNFVR